MSKYRKQFEKETGFKYDEQQPFANGDYIKRYNKWLEERLTKAEGVIKWYAAKKHIEKIGDQITIMSPEHGQKARDYLKEND